MKRAGNLICQIAEPDNLRLAFWKARNGKEGKADVIKYQNDLDQNLLLLRNHLITANVDVGYYYYFTIYDPKERVICAASFPERVLHHAIMNICHDVFEKFQIGDSYATRKSKGTYAALNRAEVFQKKYRWFLKLDIQKYFDNINHEILLQLLERRFKDQSLLQVFKSIIASYNVQQGSGVPIGNLTSQYFANYYLAYADRYIKEQLKISGYVRYMDDMVLWDNDKQHLMEAGEQTKTFLMKKLCLNLKIMFLNKNSHGLDFIGYRVFSNYTKLNKRSKNRFKLKMKNCHYKFMSNQWSEDEYQRHLLPLLSFTTHASSYGFRQKILQNIGE